MLELSTTGVSGTGGGQLLRRFQGRAFKGAASATKRIAWRMYMVVADHRRDRLRLNVWSHPYIVFQKLYVDEILVKRITADGSSATSSLEEVSMISIQRHVRRSVQQSLQLASNTARLLHASALDLLPFTSASTIRLYPSPLPPLPPSACLIFPRARFPGYQGSRQEANHPRLVEMSPDGVLSDDPVLKAVIWDGTAEGKRGDRWSVVVIVDVIYTRLMRSRASRGDAEGNSKETTSQLREAVLVFVRRSFRVDRRTIRGGIRGRIGERA